MKHHNNIRSHTGHEGLTLVEIMMTLLIFGVVMGVVTNVFFGTQGMYSQTSQRADQQMSTRAGLTVMTEEIRRAGADPNATGIVALMSAEDDTVRVRAELNDVDGIQTAEPSEDVTYFYDGVTGAVMRDSGTGPQPMIQNVTAFQIQYFDVNNNLLGPLPLNNAQSGLVRSVGISVTTDTPQGGQMTVNTRVGLRNNN
jgi:prepilin-type N-terminal cleavage/methylation domain-containing protein